MVNVQVDGLGLSLRNELLQVIVKMWLHHRLLFGVGAQVWLRLRVLDRNVVFECGAAQILLRRLAHASVEVVHRRSQKARLPSICGLHHLLLISILNATEESLELDGLHRVFSATFLPGVGTISQPIQILEWLDG